MPDLTRTAKLALRDQLLAARRRIPVLDLHPQQPGDRFPAKAVVGDVVPFSAVAFREGHDRIGVTLVLRSPSGDERRVPMEPLDDGFDTYRALAQVDEQCPGPGRVDGDGHRKLLISMPSRWSSATMLCARATESGESPWTQTDSASTGMTVPS